MFIRNIPNVYKATCFSLVFSTFDSQFKYGTKIGGYLFCKNGRRGFVRSLALNSHAKSPATKKPEWTSFSRTADNQISTKTSSNGTALTR